MKSDWKTFGHAGIKAILEKQLKAERLSHAYLFSGAEGVGKKALALEFAAKILGSDNLRTHPDFKIFEQEGQISVESIREFISALAFKPFIAKKKVAIINDAHNLNSQSGNALLKTLEEPSDSTIIILISGSNNLLPTIVSRCLTFTVNEFSEQQLRQFAEQNKIAASEEVINLSFGSIARLKALSENQRDLAGRQEDILEYDKVKRGSLGERLLEVERYGLLETEELKGKFLAWLLHSSRLLKSDPNNYKSVAALLAALEGLKINKNKKLALQGLFLAL